MRYQTPTPTPEEQQQQQEEEESYLPTNTHELTPFSSPISEKSNVDLCGNAASLLSHYDQLDDNIDDESPIICYMPEIMPSFHLNSTTSCCSRDGDVTPPLRSETAIQIVSPGGALPEELLLESTYQSSCSKRQRAAFDELEDEEDTVVATKKQRTVDLSYRTTTTTG